jgi:ubiquitin carboxyl-terminal hydrolase MINDY-1/2
MSDGFRLKQVLFNGQPYSILLQNKNGPCPLLAVINVLVLRRRVSFHPDIRYVSLSDITSQLGNAIFDMNSLSVDPSIAIQQTMQFNSVMELIPVLERGLDINIKFKDANLFEYTQELTLFDTYGVSLYHGWVIDPQDTSTYSVIKDLSYNQITIGVAEYRWDVCCSSILLDEWTLHNLVHCRASATLPSISTTTADSKENSAEATENNDVQQGSIMDAFLIDTAGQLTFYGLLRLYELVHEKELCVFFRNNHFCTLYRHDSKLYTLVTDLGYEHESSVVWELIDNIDG